MTMQQLLPLISTCFIALSAILVGIGWYHIARRRIHLHKRYMIAGAIAAIIFFIIYLSKTFFVGSTKFGGPEYLQMIYLIFLLFHIVLAMVAAVFGIITLYLGFKERYVKHRRLGKVTAVIWFITAITGVTVYVLLYVLYPGGGSAGLFEAIFG